VRRALLVVLVLAGCTPKDFVYEPRGEQLTALTQVATEFAEGRLTADLLDVEGRKALLIFGASLAYEKRERLRAAVDQVNVRIVLALAFQVLGAWSVDQSDAMIDSTLEAQSKAIDAELDREFGVSAGQLLGGKGDALSALVTQLKESREESAARLLASLKPEASCRFTKWLVSYDVGLLRFTTWEHADRSKTFAAWKKQARSLHLAEVVCDGKSGVALFSRDDEHPSPRVVAWRFSPPDQHERLIGRLYAALKAP
jgi:hypothetical protein